ncbi:MAG: SDR family NAD(P)-dependent oxidoreductase, partial [Crocinitomicaceae bacterium]|nr:SDR family NAD(P)-dependent oxidoreductase [Crocinitomicaceae bacterium]
MSKTIIVTGASRGIGLSIVKQFSKEKENTIYALSRNIDLMNRSFKEFENVHPLKIDLSENLDRQLAGLIKEIKEVDILINNAGVLIKKPFNEITQEDLLLSYQTNVFSVIKIV